METLTQSIMLFRYPLLLVLALALATGGCRAVSVPAASQSGIQLPTTTEPGVSLPEHKTDARESPSWLRGTWRVSAQSTLFVTAKAVFAYDHRRSVRAASASALGRSMLSIASGSDDLRLQLHDLLRHGGTVTHRTDSYTVTMPNGDVHIAQLVDANRVVYRGTNGGAVLLERSQ